MKHIDKHIHTFLGHVAVINESSAENMIWPWWPDTHNSLSCRYESYHGNMSKWELYCIK